MKTFFKILCNILRFGCFYTLMMTSEKPILAIYIGFVLVMGALVEVKFLDDEGGE